MLCDANGAPLGLAIDGANVHDINLFIDTLFNVPIDWPDPTPDAVQNLCLDKGYDAAWVRDQIRAWGLVPHVPRRGEDPSPRPPGPGHVAHRWVVERLHAWMNDFRRIQIRWEKKAANYKAMLHLAFSAILHRMSRE